MNGKSKAGQAFMNIARRLNGEQVPFLNLEDEGGLFGKLSRFIRSGGASNG
jgi:septum site-determining protein MinD